MTANGQPSETLRRPGFLSGRLQPDPPPADEDDLVSCPAFGYLRGVRDRALALELRFRSGECEWLPYALLAGWRYDPSVGLLLKYTSDVVTLVLVRGSNLDVPAGPGGVSLTEQGLSRHRVAWIREMDNSELRAVGDRGPTIDSIEVAEFESLPDLKVWMATNAPTFVR